MTDQMVLTLVLAGVSLALSGALLLVVFAWYEERKRSYRRREQRDMERTRRKAIERELHKVGGSWPL